MTLIDFPIIIEGPEICWFVDNDNVAMVKIKKNNNEILMPALQALEAIAVLAKITQEALEYNVENNCVGKTLE